MRSRMIRVTWHDAQLALSVHRTWKVTTLQAKLPVIWVSLEPSADRIAHSLLMSKTAPVQLR